MANSKFEDYKGSLSGKWWVFDNGEGWKQDLSFDSDKTSEQRTKVGSTNKRSCKTVPRRWEGLQWDKKKGKTMTVGKWNTERQICSGFLCRTSVVSLVVFKRG